MAGLHSAGNVAKYMLRALLMLAVRAHGQAMTKAESIWSQALKAIVHSPLPDNRLGSERGMRWNERGVDASDGANGKQLSATWEYVYRD